MKAKRKFGMGKRRVPFRSSIFRPAKAALTGHRIGTLKEGPKLSLAAARAAIKSVGGRKNVQRPRIIPLPKTGGFLPFLIPLFAGLGALGGLAGGAAGIAQAVNKAKAAQKGLVESQRHNKTMEAIALGKKGDGLYLRPYRQGMGLFLKPAKNC
ncbi:hypothetical protein QE152_g22068 [Popillia japonica]|uniref:Uncharacterized protein n=1 Tax=Popillia japonica TaxID=7064 RepID=A0AAW1KLM1_POPJA